MADWNIKIKTTPNHHGRTSKQAWERAAIFTLNPECIKHFSEVLKYFEVEILQGKTTQLENGQTRYEFEVPEEKEGTLKAIFLEIQFNLSKQLN